MDNTLDTIRASSDVTIQEEVSYLYGRDPSIISYGQQRFISKDSQKNLYSLYEEEETNSVISDNALPQTVKVYLRMKPFPQTMKLSSEEIDAYTIANSSTLLTKMSNLEYNTSCLKRPKSSDAICKKFTFTQTFGPSTTQHELFEQAICPQMVDFLAGQNATVMTYGTTNSGKSYTLQGTTSSPGIIPRALEFIFSNINPKPTPYYKPINHSDIIPLDGKLRLSELDIKTNLLTFGSMDKNQYINAYKEMQKLLQEETATRQSQCTEGFYSVWVSFAEIYNETIYDLLSNNIQTRRPALKLSTDSQGRSFIKGLKTVCVNSGAEAYQILMAGQYNLKVAATALNARSSRSHCIFTVTLLKYFSENCPESVEVSTFAFCDLAGSERLKKTLNEGERLKEAQNINTSLLVLGRCLKSVYETQGSKQKSNIIGPFRESKLTRLFQKALSGNESMALIVNVNPVPNLYVETQNVLNFSAIAKKIVIEPKKTCRKKSTSRFSKIVSQSIKTVTDWDTMDYDNIEETETESEQDGDVVYREDYEELLDENKQLKQQIINLKNSAAERDFKTRQELSSTYSEMMKKIELDWRNRIKDVEEQHEDQLEYYLRRTENFYKEKINQLKSRKRIRSELDDSEEDDLEDLEEENANLQSKLESYKETIKNLREQKETEVAEKAKLSFELGLVKNELKNVKSLLQTADEDIQNESNENFIKELKSQLSAEREKNKQLKIFLNEAKEEYIEITNDGRRLEEKLKSREELLLEYEDKMLELEKQLDDANVCFSEKVKLIEILEDKVDGQNKVIEELQEDILNLKEKQHVQRNVMRSEKETMTCQETCTKEDTFKAEVLERSMQTLVPDFVDSEIQTENVKIETAVVEIQKVDVEIQTENFEDQLKNSKMQTESVEIQTETFQTEAVQIKREMDILLEDKNLQTSLLDTSRQQRIDELDELKQMFSNFEIETEYKKTDYETKIEDLEETIKKCREEHELTKQKMEEVIGTAKNVDEFKSQFLEEYKNQVDVLQKELSEAKELKEQITELNCLLEEIKSEKANLQITLESDEKKYKSLEIQLEKMSKDKDIEISTLQKEVKELIQSQKAYDESRDRDYEKQIKLTLKKLTNTEEILSQELSRNKALQKQKDKVDKELQAFEQIIQNAKFLEEREKYLKEEIAELKENNNILRHEIDQKTVEFDTFSRHRDDTITRYENLVHNLQEDVDREKKEKIRLQDLFQKHLTPTPNKDEVQKLKSQLEQLQEQLETLEKEKIKEKQTQKTRRTKRRDKENYENTTDDEGTSCDRKKSSRVQKPSPATTNEGSIIELSSTESKRQTRLRQVLGPPETVPICEKKKTSRRKKLFYQEKDEFVDLEPVESQTPPAQSPLSSFRSLRSRKK